LGTTVVKNQKPMSSGVMAVSTIASMNFPCLFAKRGLLSPDHQDQVMMILQNLGEQRHHKSQMFKQWKHRKFE
jgi:hypothetical protein